MHISYYLHPLFTVPPVPHADVLRYIPILWFDDQRVMDPESAATLFDEFLVFVDFTLGTAWDGLVGSGILAGFGSILWAVFRYLKVKFDRRRWID